MMNYIHNYPDGLTLIRLPANFMVEQLSPLDLFHYLQKNIDLKWLAGKGKANKPLKKTFHLNQQSTLVGHLNLIHPNRIQVIGKKEFNYLNKNAQSSKLLRDIFSRRTAAIVFTNGLVVSGVLPVLPL